MFSRIGNWRIALGIVALGVLLVPEIVIVCAISIVGIPLAILLVLAPPFFVLSMAAWIIGAPFRPAGAGWVGWPAAVALSALLAFVINAGMDRDVAKLVAGDRDDIGAPHRIKMLAVLTSGHSGWSRGQTRCDDFCQRALLTGAVDRIIVAQVDDPAAAPDISMSGPSFRIERRSECPAVTIVEGRNAFSDYSEGPRPAEALRLKIAKGECLIEEQALVGAADAVIVQGTVKKGHSSASAGLNPFAGSVRADRLSYYEKSGGAFVEAYRRTGVAADKHLPLLLPSAVPAYGLDMAAGFWRNTEMTNRSSRYEPNEFGPFVTKTLALDLALPEMDDVAPVLDSALGSDAPIEANVAAVTADFFERLDREKNVSRADAERALAVLQDERWDVPRYTGRAVGKVLKAHPDLAAPMAEALFQRLAVTDAAQKENHPSYLGYTLSYAADGIMALPDDAIAPYREALETLARDPAKRVRVYRILSKLAIFGPDAIPTFLYLIDAAAAQGEDRGGERVLSGDDWQHPYLGAMYGLCALGPAGAPAIPELLARLEAGAMPRYASYWRLTIHTFIALGADPEDLWPRLQTGGEDQTRELFDREVRRAGKKIDCNY